MLAFDYIKKFIKYLYPEYSTPGHTHTHLGKVGKVSGTSGYSNTIPNYMSMPGVSGIAGPEQARESWRDWFEQTFCPTCQGIEWIILKEFDNWNSEQEYVRYRVSACKTCKKLSLIEMCKVKKQYDIEEKEPLAFLEKCMEKANELKDEIMSVTNSNTYTTTYATTHSTSSTTCPPKSTKRQRPRPTTPPPPQKSNPNKPKELDPPKYDEVIEYKPSKKLKDILRRLENENP